jgi:hypothetical protein
MVSQSVSSHTTFFTNIAPTTTTGDLSLAGSYDGVIAVDAWESIVHINLPPSDGNTAYYIKKIDGSANEVKVCAFNATIEGMPTRSLASQSHWMRIISHTSGSWLYFA